MPDSLDQLQQQRAEIVRQTGQLGDLRPGSSVKAPFASSVADYRCL